MKSRFLSIIFVTTIALLILPTISRASPQDHWYAVTNWTGYTSPMGMTLGTNGLIYIAEAGLGQIRVVTTNGVTVTNWSGFSAPRDVAVSTNGLVYVCDTGNNMIKVLDHAGNAVTNWGGTGTNEAHFSTPTTVSILRSGNIVVADGGNYRIQVFDPMGGFVRKWGEPGGFNGQFHNAYGAYYIESEVMPDGLIYVSERDMTRIQIFDEGGAYLGDHPTHPSATYVRPYLTRGLNDFFYWVTTSSFYSGHSWRYTGNFSAYGRDGELLQTLFTEDIYRSVSDISPASPGSGHVLELPDGTLLIAREAGFIAVYKRSYRNYTYDPGASNSVPVPVVIRAEQRPGTTWMDIDYIVHDGNDAAISVAALAFADGGTNLDSVLKINTLVENTGTNLGPGIASGIEHHLTWDVAADWSTNYANVQVEILARDARELLDFHFVTVPSNGPNAKLTINKSMISDADFLHVWMWLIATGDPEIALVSGSVIGQTAPYTGLELASGNATTANGRAFLFARFGGVEASAGEKQRAIDARAIVGDESDYWIKLVP